VPQPKQTISTSTVAATLRLRRGNGASVARIVPYAALHYATYERFRAVIAPAALRLLPPPSGAGAASGHASRRRPPVWVDLLSGSCSGATAVAVTYPLDLVRTRVAWNTEAGGGASIRATMRAIFAREGLRGLYRVRTPSLSAAWQHIDSTMRGVGCTASTVRGCNCRLLTALARLTAHPMFFEGKTLGWQCCRA
jgi:Mitochondrial carrier protein